MPKHSSPGEDSVGIFWGISEIPEYTSKILEYNKYTRRVHLKLKKPEMIFFSKLPPSICTLET